MTPCFGHMRFFIYIDRNLHGKAQYNIALIPILTVIYRI